MRVILILLEKLQLFPSVGTGTFKLNRYVLLTAGFTFILAGFSSEGRLIIKSHPDFNQTAFITSYDGEKERVLGVGFFTAEYLKNSRPFFVTSAVTALKMYQAENNSLPENIFLEALDLKHNLALFHGVESAGRDSLFLMPSLSLPADGEHNNFDIRFFMYQQKSSIRRKITAHILLNDSLKRIGGFIIPESLTEDSLIYVLFNWGQIAGSEGAPVWIYPSDTDKHAPGNGAIGVLMETENNMGVIVSNQSLVRLIVKAQFSSVETDLLHKGWNALKGLVDPVSVDDKAPPLSFEKILEKELKNLKKSAKNGDSLAQFRLAGIFRDGSFLPRDINKSLKWFEESAKRYPPARYEWAVTQLRYEAVRPEALTQIMGLLESSADGYPPAKHLLALLILSDPEGEKDKTDRALKLFKENSSFYPSQLFMAKIELENANTEQSVRRARNILTKLNLKGYPDSDSFLYHFKTEEEGADPHCRPAVFLTK